MTKRALTILAAGALFAAAPSLGRAQATDPEPQTPDETEIPEPTDASAEPEAGVPSGEAPLPAEPDSPSEELEQVPDPVEMPAAGLPEEGAEAAEGEDLIPPGEEELMGEHPVDATGISFVPGKGLRLTSADGRFRLETRARVQIGWEGTGPDGGPWGQEVRLRRARLQLAGFMFTDRVRFKMELAVSPNDMGIKNNLDSDGAIATRSPLLDFYIDFRPLRDLQFRVGQYKIPSNRQRVISSGNLQLVDRSIFNREFTLDRDVGFDVRSRDFLGLDMLRYYAGVYIARGRGARGVDDFGMMYLARLEFLPFGLFEDYSEADFERAGPRLSVGVNYTHIDRARRDRGILGSAPEDGGTTDTQHVFFDAMFKWAGFSTLFELGWRHGVRIPGNAIDDMGNPMPVAIPRNGVGGNIQAGYLLPGLPVELAGRYSFLRGLGDVTETSLENGNELTVGASYYPGRHPYKVQLDYSRLWNDTIDEGDHRVRLQLQVAL